MRNPTATVYRIPTMQIDNCGNRAVMYPVYIIQLYRHIVSCVLFDLVCIQDPGGAYQQLWRVSLCLYPVYAILPFRFLYTVCNLAVNGYKIQAISIGSFRNRSILACSINHTAMQMYCIQHELIEGLYTGYRHSQTTRLPSPCEWQLAHGIQYAATSVWRILSPPLSKGSDPARRL